MKSLLLPALLGTLVALAAADPSARPFAFFEPAIRLSAADRDSLDSGKVIARVLPADDGYVTFFAAARLKARPEALIEWTRAIEQLKRGPMVLAVGRLSDPVADDELDALVRTNEILLTKGFKETTDAYTLKKQRIDLTGERAKLRSGIQRLNAELKSLLAIDPGAAGFLLPADQVTVAPDPIDPDVAVQVGLRNRADLNLIRSLSGMADHRTLPAVQRVLAAEGEDAQ